MPTPYDTGWGSAFETGYSGAQDRAFRDRQLALSAEIQRGELSLRRAAEERQRQEQMLREQQREFDRQNPDVAAFPTLMANYPTPDAQDPVARVTSYSRELPRTATPAFQRQGKLELARHQDPYTRQELFPAQQVPGVAPIDQPDPGMLTVRPEVAPGDIRAVLEQRRAEASKEALDAFQKAQADAQTLKNAGRGGGRNVPLYAKPLEIVEGKLMQRLNDIGNRRQGIVFYNNQAQFVQDLLQPGAAGEAARKAMDTEEFSILSQLRDLEIAYKRLGESKGHKLDTQLLSPQQYYKMRVKELDQLNARRIPGWSLMTPQQRLAKLEPQIEKELSQRVAGTFANPYGQ